MEFLVEIDVNWPPDGDSDRKTALVEAEAARASELAEAGTLVRLWRTPGRWSNVGIWSVDDADELHSALTSLPFYPWLDIRVRPLAQHPNDPQRNQS